MAACGGVIAAQQSLGPGGVFGVIALIAMAVYLLGGIAYQRTVMHQRGWRQLPNYTLWAGIFGVLNVGASSLLLDRYAQEGELYKKGRSKTDILRRMFSSF